MRRVVCLTVLLAAAISPEAAHAGEQEIRACNFEVKARCASGDARVTLADGVVKRIEIDVIMCGQTGAPGYLCTVDYSRGDKDSIWSEDGRATVVANASPSVANLPDRMKITVGRYVSIDLAEAQSGGHAAPERNCRGRSSFRLRKAHAACGSIRGDGANVPLASLRAEAKQSRNL